MRARDSVIPPCEYVAGSARIVADRGDGFAIEPARRRCRPELANFVTDTADSVEPSVLAAFATLNSIEKGICATAHP